MAARSMNVCARLKSVRVHLRLTQAEMAGQMGISTRAYQTYEAAQRQPRAVDLAALAEVGIDLNWLLTGAGSMLRAAQEPPPASGAPAAPATVDEDLMARVAEGVAEIYRSENVRIYPGPIAREQARVYNELIAACDTPEERLGALKLALHRLRRDLRTPTTETGSSKEAP